MGSEGRIEGEGRTREIVDRELRGDEEAKGLVEPAVHDAPHSDAGGPSGAPGMGEKGAAFLERHTAGRTQDGHSAEDHYESYTVFERDGRRPEFEALHQIVPAFFRPIEELLVSMGLEEKVPQSRENRADISTGDVYGSHYYRDRSFYEGLPYDGVREADGVHYFPIWDLEGKSYEVPGEGMVTFTGRVFGQGSASTVYEAVFDRPGVDRRIVAVKIRDHALYPRLGEQAALREVDTMMKLPVDIAPNYYGMANVEGATGIVMDVAPGQFWTKVDPNRINENTLQDIDDIFDTLEGMGWKPGDFQVTIDVMGHAHLIDFEGLNLSSEFPTTRKDIFRWMAKLRRNAGLSTEFIDRRL